jgi:hypothetical protein
MREETNLFLENQKKVIQQREALRAGAKTFPVGVQAENERGYPTPQVQQPFNPDAPIKVERLDVATGVVTTREIPFDRSIPPRPAKPTAPTLEELRQSLEEVGSNVDAAREGFQADNSSLDAYFGREEQKQLRSDIARLQAELAEKQNRLLELTSKPLPRDSFYSSIKDAEHSVVRIARTLVEVLSDQASQKVFGVSLSKLSPASKRDVQLRYLHALEKYLDFGGSFVKLARDEKATSDVIDARAQDLLEAVNDILDKEFLAGN